LEARGIVARYGSQEGDRDALRGVDLSVMPGEMTVVIGPNGAGKSTLVRVLTGTLAPVEGSVRLFGTNLGELGRKEIARRLAVVEQANHAQADFTAREIVMMGRA